jgi:anti-anti-sigma regulatory factor
VADLRVFRRLGFFCALVESVDLALVALVGAASPRSKEDRDEKEMAKYRHPIFEMYEFRDEAIHALMPMTTSTATEATAPESWTFKHLAVSRTASITLVEFKSTQVLEEETLSDLRADFEQLANNLIRDSKVLLDFTNVEQLCAASIKEIVLFNQKLRTKGSRIALCCLGPVARESFFAARD